MIVTLTRDGYVKRTSLDTFRAQHRGGRGRIGGVHAAGRRGDAQLHRAYPSMGAVLHQPRHGLPREGLAAAGRRRPGQGPQSLRQVLALQEGEQITAVLPLPQDESLWEGLHLVFATASRRRPAQQAVGLPECPRRRPDRDEAGGRRRLIGVSTCREGDDVLLATRKGRAIRFQASRRRAARLRRPRQHRRARHPALGKDDEVIALRCCAMSRRRRPSARRRSATPRSAGAARTATARTAGEEAEAPPPAEDVEDGAEEAPATRSPSRRSAPRELEEAEEIILAVTDGGFGKRSLGL